ncbi:Failed axon connections homolog [Coccomyxa sp. Obi]|nr:Failed axon connections homolog [Coccomyxa sp. Obi]
MTGFPEVSLPSVRTQQAIAATAVAGFFGVWFWFRRSRSVSTPIVPDSLRSGSPSNEITLIGFPRVSDVVSSCSPYVAKVEAWLRFVRLPYTRTNGGPNDSPKGQLPVIWHGKNTVADSYFIIKYLERTYSDVIPQLSAEQEALSVAIQHLVDDCLMRGLAYHRWVQPQGFEGVKKHYMKGVREPLRTMLLQQNVRTSVQDALLKQGLGRHSERDINLMMDEGLAALSAILGDKRYLLGGQPCVADASAFGFLDNVFFDTDCLNPGLREIAQQYDNLVAYTERIRSTYFEGELQWEETY